VSFHIEDGLKVGVVGRTGSGKTTLLMALFRMFDLAGGRILLDGVDLASQPLQEVRKRIAIIPQEPVMFKGSVRSNLDPFGEASDAELWRALSVVSLRAAVSDMGGLDAAVQVGQPRGRRWAGAAGLALLGWRCWLALLAGAAGWRCWAAAGLAALHAADALR
jgi:ABC-type multidrug transport system fused ATPase/permease subunit